MRSGVWSPHCCCVEQSSGQICPLVSKCLSNLTIFSLGHLARHPRAGYIPRAPEPPTRGQLQSHTPYSEQILRAPQPGHARMRWRQDRKPGQKARRHWEGREPSLWSLQSPVQNFCSINNIAMTGLAERPHSFYREIFSCKNVKIAMRHASGLSADAL